MGDEEHGLSRPRPDAQELLLTGERVDAERALRAGLLTAVAPDEGLDAMVASYVEALTAGGPQALTRTRELLRRIPATDVDEAFGIAAQMSAELFASDEAREGMTAFLERRPAVWGA